MPVKVLIADHYNQGLGKPYCEFSQSGIGAAGKAAGLESPSEPAGAGSGKTAEYVRLLGNGLSAVGEFFSRLLSGFVALFARQPVTEGNLSAPASFLLDQGSGSYRWQYACDGLSRLVYACSDWDAATGTCLGDSFDYSYRCNRKSRSLWDLNYSLVGS